MTYHNNYQIRDITTGSQHWRIDWFGAVTYAERYRRKSQPLIEVQLSEIPDGVTNANELFRFKNDQWPQTRQVKLPVGFLSLLKIGDIWRDGRLVESPAYDTMEFDHLPINRSTTTLIKAGVSEENSKSFYIPISHHPYHIRHTQSYCLLVKGEHSPIIFPSIELLRFYFGSSSNLISRIFDTPFEPAKFWTHIDLAGRGVKPKIHLASGLSGRSASDIARIALSRTAQSAVQLIGNSCIAATVNSERTYPKAVFPFEGQTNLAVSGKWLPFAGKERGVFLVFKLLSCSYPFPFSGLHYTSERKGTSSNQSNDEASKDGGETGQFRNRFFKAREDAKKIGDAEPTNARTSRDLNTISSGKPQFPDLARKAIQKIDADDAPTVLHSLAGTTVITDSSVGEGGRDTKIQQIDIIGAIGEGKVLAGQHSEGNALASAIFLNLTSKFRDSHRFSSVDIVRLSPRQRFDHRSTMPRIIDENGKVCPACLIATPTMFAPQSQASTRHRRISIGRVLDSYSAHIFMVPEPQATNESGAVNMELHVITDITNAIVTTADLLSAIAAHFSTAEAPATSSEVGFESKIFTFSCDDQTEASFESVSGKMSHAFFEYVSMVKETLEDADLIWGP